MDPLAADAGVVACGPTAAVAGVVVGRGLMTMVFSDVEAGVVVSMTANKINISNCDQRYGTINGSGEVFSNNMRSD